MPHCRSMYDGPISLNGMIGPYIIYRAYLAVGPSIIEAGNWENRGDYIQVPGTVPGTGRLVSRTDI